MTDTTTPTTVQCPECGGTNMLDHPAGALAWRHATSCPMLRCEDATRAADAESPLRWPTRPASVTERLLLATVLGHTMPSKLDTTLTSLTPSVVRRSWPTLGL